MIDIAHLLILIVVVAALIALMYVALNYFGVGIPSWVVRIFWIVVVAVVVIYAIRLLVGLL